MKAIVYAMVLLTSLAAVAASTHGSFPGGYQGYANDECMDRGFSHAVTKWEYVDGQWRLDESEGFTDMGESVTGDGENFHWDVGSSGADGIAVKIPGQAVEKAYHGSSGDVTMPEGTHAAHAVFCEGDGGEEIPEFSTVAAGVAVTGAGAAFLMLRKRK